MPSEMTVAISPESVATFPEDPTVTIAPGVTSEHIFLESGEGEETADLAGQYTVSQRYELNNRGRGIRTELTFFSEGFMNIREQRRGKPSKSQLINLRYLDPTPLSARFVALKVLYSGLGMAGFGTLLGVLACFSIVPEFALPAAICSLTVAMIAFMLFLYQTHEHCVFYTSNGRAEVLSLLASMGSIRVCRGLIPKIAEAIDEAHERNPTEKSRYLREEMREHYRLREDGILSADACAQSTQRILARYD